MSGKISGQEVWAECEPVTCRQEIALREYNAMKLEAVKRQELIIETPTYFIYELKRAIFKHWISRIIERRKKLKFQFKQIDSNQSSIIKPLNVITKQKSITRQFK